MSNKPWDVHSSLTEERLTHIARIVREVRNCTADLHEPENGDGPWSLGCRVYERTINAIEKEAERQPWLDVRRKGLYLLCLVGSVPIRFHREDDVANPHQRTLQRLDQEVEATEQFEFPFDTSQWFWRLIVLTDERGFTLRVVIVQYTEKGNSRNLWEIPVGDKVMAVTASGKAMREGVVLDEPAVSPKYNKRKKAAGDESGN